MLSPPIYSETKKKPLCLSGGGGGKSLSIAHIANGALVLYFGGKIFAFNVCAKISETRLFPLKIRATTYQGKGLLAEILIFIKAN